MARTGTERIPEAKENEITPSLKSNVIEELEKYAVVQHSAEMYNGVVNRLKVTRAIADGVQAKISSLGHAAIQTRWGAKIDELLAHVLSEVGRLLSDDRQEASAQRPEASDSSNGHLVWLFHLWFRFFPPLFLLRWCLLLALLATELTLALVKDFVRMGPYSVAVQATDTAMSSKENHEADDTAVVSSPRSDKPPCDVDNSEATCRSSPKPKDNQPEPEHENAAGDETEKMVLRPKRARADNFRMHFWNVALYLVLFTYCIGRIFALYILLPALSVQFYLLESCNDVMYRLAGMERSGDSDGEALKDGLLDIHLIGSSEVPFAISRRKWLTDVVLERTLVDVSRCPVGAMFLNWLKLNRPVAVCRRIHKALRKQVNKYKFGDMVPYLQLDKTYNELEDPDFEPSESSEDDDSITSVEDEDVDKVSKNGAVESCNGDKNGNAAEMISQKERFGPDSTSHMDVTKVVGISCESDEAVMTPGQTGEVIEDAQRMQCAVNCDDSSVEKAGPDDDNDAILDDKEGKMDQATNALKEPESKSYHDVGDVGITVDFRNYVLSPKPELTEEESDDDEGEGIVTNMVPLIMKPMSAFDYYDKFPHLAPDWYTAEKEQEALRNETGDETAGGSNDETALSANGGPRRISLRELGRIDKRKLAKEKKLLARESSNYEAESNQEDEELAKNCNRKDVGANDAEKEGDTILPTDGLPVADSADPVPSPIPSPTPLLDYKERIPGNSAKHFNSNEGQEAETQECFAENTGASSL